MKSFAKQLIDGSERQDRLKREIALVLGMVGSFLSSDYWHYWRLIGPMVTGPAKDEVLIFGSGTSTVWRLQKPASGEWLEIKLITDTEFQIGVETEFLYTHCLKGALKSYEVEAFHQSLDALLDGLVSVYPGLTTVWEPVVKSGSREE